MTVAIKSSQIAGLRYAEELTGLVRRGDGTRVLFEEPLAPRTTIRTGGAAECLVETGSMAALRVVVGIARKESVPLHVLGYGSNVLVSSAGVAGIVVVLSGEEFRQFEVEGARVWTGGGMSLGTAIGRMARLGLDGAADLAGIPASVGGGVAMNCGTKCGWISERLDRVRILTWDSELIECDTAELPFVYRSGPKDGVVVGARFALTQSDPKACRTRLADLLRERKATQPVSEATAGCFFRNPAGIHARDLIREAGFEGVPFGGAMVSDKHANFLVNAGDAAAEDFMRLVREIQQRVRQRHGIELTPEVQFWGFDD